MALALLVQMLQPLLGFKNLRFGSLACNCRDRSHLEGGGCVSAVEVPVK